MVASYNQSRDRMINTLVWLEQEKNYSADLLRIYKKKAKYRF